MFFAKNLSPLCAEHPSTLTSMGNLASTYRNQGRRKKAKVLEAQVMETSSRVFGAEHPCCVVGAHKHRTPIDSTPGKPPARSINQVNHHPSQQYTHAEQHGQRRQLISFNVGRRTEIRKRVLGVEHPDMLNRMANLASTFWE
jgi:hypothetical protein